MGRFFTQAGISGVESPSGAVRYWSIVPMEEELPYRLAGFEIPIYLAESLYAGQRFLKREPERSRRALRLVYANWLAHIEIPELRQQRPAVRAMFSFGEERQQYSALSRQSPGAGRRPIDITPRSSKLARLDQRRQETVISLYLAIRLQTGAERIS